MTIVQGKLIGQPNPTRVRVTATLVDLDGEQRLGYVDAQNGEIPNPVPATPDTSGAWSLDLVPNSQIVSDYGDTLWKITEGRTLDGTPIDTYIAVPASGGPYWMGDLRTDPPGGATPQSYAVLSVNGQRGAVALDAGDVGADPAGSAAAATSAAATYTDSAIAAEQTRADAAYDAAGEAAAAQTAAAADATAKVTAHAASADPHADRAYTDTAIAGEVTRADAAYDAAGAAAAAQSAAATDATTKVNNHAAAADPHGDRAYAVGQFVPQAQYTIDQLLANDPFYIAHRGGGAAMPEHTIAAWDSAVAAGALAIEVSCHASADGVLFCMHDTTLDRMTNGTWTGAHSTWTWAQLQQKAKIVSTALLGPGWADQPIPTVREVLDRYLGRVVIFLEAKSSSAVVPLQTMLGTYKGANKSVVWKNYYTSNSFPWAKANGYRTWAYMDATTTSAQLDAVEANVDYWGIPIDAADSQFQMVLTRPTFKPVITWPVWRRSERDRVVAFNYGGHHVQGIMCSEFLYVPRTTAINTSSSFGRGIRAPGQIGAAKEDQAYALKFDTANSAVYAPATSGNGVLMGNFCPVAQGATGYKITFDMMFPALPSGTLHAGLWFGAANDNKHQFAAANDIGSYRMLFRPNSGAMQLYTVAPGATSGVQVGTDLTTAAVTAGQWASLEIEVNATQVIFRRTDSTGWSKTFTDSTYRGLYFGIHNGSLTDVNTLPKFRNMNVVQV